MGFSDFIFEGPFPRVWTDADWNKPGYLGNKLTNIKLFSLARPHMSAFHAAWFSFFSCFLMWFAIPAIMPTLKKPACLATDHPVCMHCMNNTALFTNGKLDMKKFEKDATCLLCAPYSDNGGCGGMGPNWVDQWYKGPKGPLTRKAANFTKPQGLTVDDITYSNVAGVGGTIILRLIIGPFAEQYGVRLAVSFILILCSIPGFLVAVLQPGDVASFFAIRFFISFAGATFVTTSLWSSTMFAHTVVGLAIATTAGWGNLGGGVTLAMHPVIFSGYKSAGYTNDTAWRCTLMGPPALMMLLGFLVYCATDDCPTGNFVALKRRAAAAAAAASGSGAVAAARQQGSMGASFMLAAKNYRTWIMGFNYAFTFGIELVVNKNVVLYFNQAFDMSQYNAGLAVPPPLLPRCIPAIMNCFHPHPTPPARAWRLTGGGDAGVHVRADQHLRAVAGGVHLRRGGPALRHRGPHVVPAPLQRHPGPPHDRLLLHDLPHRRHGRPPRHLHPLGHLPGHGQRRLLRRLPLHRAHRLRGRLVRGGGRRQRGCRDGQPHHEHRHAARLLHPGVPGPGLGAHRPAPPLPGHPRGPRRLALLRGRAPRGGLARLLDGGGPHLAQPHAARQVPRGEEGPGARQAPRLSLPCLPRVAAPDLAWPSVAAPTRRRLARWRCPSCFSSRFPSSVSF